MSLHYSLAVALPHAPWRPERVRSVERIRSALRLGAPATWAAPSQLPARGYHVGLVSYHEETHRGPMHEWQDRLWAWATSQPVSHVLCLADDTVLGPYAIESVLAMIEARPRDPIGLSSQHPAAPRLLREGHRWYRSSSPWLVGWGYVLPRTMLEDFVAYRAAQPLDFSRGVEGGDDQQINKFLAATEITTWHPLPTPLDHDLAIESEYGHPIEAGGRREASTKATWTLHAWRPSGEPCTRPPWAEAAWWKTETIPPVLECPPSETSWAEWLGRDPATSTKAKAL